MNERRHFRALAMVLPALAACTALTGVDDLNVAGDAGADGGSILSEGGPDGAAADATPADGSTPTLDASAESDAGVCLLAANDAAAIVTAPPVTTKPTIDGDLADWPCAFTELNLQNAGGSIGTPMSTGKYAVEWDASGLYFACHVIDADPEGTGSEPYENDACEFYFGTAAAADGSPVAGDFHYVVDYKNLARFYPTYTSSSPIQDGVVTAASVVADGFVVEMYVPAAVLGFTPDVQMLSFDMQIDDNQDPTVSSAAGQLLAYDEPTGDLDPCPNDSVRQPACDTRTWGQISLAP